MFLVRSLLSITAAAAMLSAATACHKDDDWPDPEPEPKPKPEQCDSEPAPPSPWLPPPDPKAGPAQDPGEVTLALRRIYFGDTTWEGIKDSKAWQLFGFDLDGLVTTECSRDHCYSRYFKDSGIDGPGGLDNTFGSLAVPWIPQVIQEPSTETNQAIASGKGTYLIRLRGTNLSQNGNQIEAAWLAAADRSEPPVWDGSDVWPVRDDSVAMADLEQPRVTFPKSYVAEGTWVSGAPVGGAIAIAIEIRGSSPFPKIRLHRPMLAMRTLSGTPLGVRGIITGIIYPDEFLGELGSMAGAVTYGCYSDFFAFASKVARIASDIVADGSNGNPSIDCSGISAGIGFEAVPAKLGAVVPAPPEPYAPCPK